MTTSQKVGLAIVFGAVVFLLMAAYGVLPGLIAVCVIALRLVWGIGVLYVIAYIKNAGSRKRKASNTPHRRRAPGSQAGCPFSAGARRSIRCQIHGNPDLPVTLGCRTLRPVPRAVPAANRPPEGVIPRPRHRIRAAPEGWRRRTHRHGKAHEGRRAHGRMHAMLGGAPHHFPLFLLVRSVSRLGCTRFGSPGILG